MSTNFLKKLFKPIERSENNLHNSVFENVSKKKFAILTDQEEENPISPDNKFDFSKYSAAICNIIRDSNHKYSIGIFSEWGTGKTTLMRMISIVEH